MDCGAYCPALSKTTPGQTLNPGAILRGTMRNAVTSPSLIVVGAGVAGLTLAAILGSRGYRVTLLEKNDRPGGRAAQMQRDGFTFDLGPTLLFMPDVYRSAFALWGGDFDREVPLARLHPNYTMHFGDGRTLSASSSLPDTVASLEACSPGASAGLLRYLARAAESYELSRREFVDRRIAHWSEFLHPRKVRALVRAGAFKSLSRNAVGAFGSAEIASAFSFQSMYLGMSPFLSPALYSLLFFTEMGEGVFFPYGGIGSFVRALERAAQNNGVNIVYNAEVDRVEREGARVRALHANQERYAADAYIFSADLPYVYEALLGEPAHRSTRMRFTPSALLIYAALDRRYAGLQHHEFLMPRSLRETCRDIFENGAFPRDPAIYLSSPAATDRSLAPPGADALYLLVPVPNLQGQIDWSTRKDELVERVLSTVQDRRLPGLRDRIRWIETRTPEDFRSVLNLSKGAAFGLSHDVLQIGPLRPDNRHKKYRNVYFAGASTRPATGLPLVTLGAMQTAQRICEEVPVRAIA